MTFDARGVDTLRQRARVVAAAGTVAAAALAFAAPGRIGEAWRLAGFACLAPAIGCLIFSLIHRTTGGQWAPGLRPFLRAGVALLPWVWVLTLPVLLIHGLPRPGANGHGWEGLPLVTVRSALFAVLLFWLRSRVLAWDGSDTEPTANPSPWVGPVGLIALVLASSFVADDWIEATDPDWHSTAFPVVWLAGQAVSGFALCVFAAARAGARPAKKGSAGRTVGNDWGNLMLASLVFWGYVTFLQYLIIWAGNLPHEIGWFVRRQQGGWALVPLLLGIFDFAFPFALLLSRRLKDTPGGLAAAAALLIGSQVLFDAWLILPAEASWSPAGLALAAALLVAAAAAFLDRYCVAALRAAVPAP